MVMLSEAFFTKGFRLEGHRISCCFDYLGREFSTRFWLFFMVIIGYLIPNLVIVTSYICLYRVVQQSRIVSNINKEKSNESKKLTDKIIKGEMNLAKKILGQIIIFNIAWTPYVCVIFIAQFGDEKTIHLYVTPFVMFIIDFVSKLFVLFINIFHAYWNWKSSKREKILAEAQKRACISYVQARNVNSHISKNLENSVSAQSGTGRPIDF